MSLPDFLSSLLDKGIRLWVEGDQLRYRAPAGAMTKEMRAVLVEQKAELLRFLRLNNQIINTVAPAMLPVVRNNRIPLSFAQERLWFINQLQPGGTGYNIPVTLCIVGGLRVEVLERTINEIMRRHETLRTIFQMTEAGPVQVIQEYEWQALPMVDLVGLPERKQERTARELMVEERERPFDLSRGPLVWVRLFRLGPTDHVVSLTLHHIISDGWSMGVFNRELGVLYEAFANSQPSPLPELPIQYADFAVWQREWLQGEVLEKQLSYWKEQLAGLSPLQLPTDHPRPAIQTFNGATQELRVSSETTKGLRGLCREGDVTLFMTFLAGFEVLLSRYSGQEDIVVGSPIANRNREEIEGLIGFFVNMLVMRVNLGGDPTVLELLERVKEVSLGAYGHQDLPFEKLVEELQPERDMSRNPLVQVVFVLQNAPGERVEMKGLALRFVSWVEIKPRFDLEVYLWETELEIMGTIFYNTDLFESRTIGRMAGYFEWVLEGIASNPAQRVSELVAGPKVELPLITFASKETDKEQLSYHQERLWFIEEFERGNVYEKSPIYHNIPLIVQLDGTVDEKVMEESLNEIIGRHEALRTRVVSQKEQVWQIVRPVGELKLKIANSPSGPIETDFERALEFALNWAQQPFDLGRDQLIRALLLKLRPGLSLLAVGVHHIVADRESMRLIVEELWEIYEARMRGRKPRLAGLDLQYRDYTRWQRTLPESATESLFLHWKRQLGRSPAALKLPGNRRRPPVHTFTAARHSFRLDPDLIRAIDAFARSRGSEAFAVFLAGFKVMLRWYAQQDEIVVGTSVSARNHAGIQKVIGPIGNLLVLRSQLQEGESFAELVGRVSRAVELAREHQEMQFDWLVQKLNPEIDMSRTALFDVLFQFEERSIPEWKGENLEARIVETNLGYGKYDLSFYLHPDGEGLSGKVVHNRDIYDDWFIEQMLKHYETVLRAMVADPGQQIGRAVFLSRAEELEQLEKWNATNAEYPGDKTIHQLFAEQAARTPEHTALVCGETKLSYRQLEERANRLANYLVAKGLRREELIALCLERSPEMIVALLGVLKAGGAYLPLDPAFPRERLQFMIQDADVAHLITTRTYADLAEKKGVMAILLDAEKAEIASQSASPPKNDSRPEDLIYCIYTSGSTGVPKGMLLEHRQVVRLLINDRLPFEFSDRDVWSLFHSYGFDFSVWEMYGALLYGGKLVIVPKVVSQDSKEFLKLLLQERVTVLNQTPTAFNLLMKEVLRSKPPDLALRYVIFGGEALEPFQLKEWRELYPEVRLINMYGITETTVHVTFKAITEHEIQENQSNIGVPIPTARAYIMDNRLRLLPVGVPGELYVGGAGVGRGYLKRDELTAEKFVHNPYRKKERLYRSGDLAKLLPNGEMVYLGRIDDQIQLRGFRVEIGEIERVMARHPLVRESVVVAREDRPGDLRLVGYVVAWPLERDEAGEREHVLEWKDVWNEHLYAEPVRPVDPTFNTVSWNSTYTGQPIPAEEMREVLDDTISSVCCTRSDRILEIGCGTGLLLFRLAHQCAEYWGTDFSPWALNYIEGQMGRMSRESVRVKLLQRHADNFEGMEDEKFNWVILNSVIQYFPDVPYLLRVLEKALKTVEEGGVIFLGDVRSLPLLETYHTSVQLHQAASTLPVKQLQQQIQLQMKQEEELLLDPGFFTSLPRQFPQIRHVEIKPKNVRTCNELTRFRYQVILHVGIEPKFVKVERWLNWGNQRKTLEDMRRILREEHPAKIGIKGMANRRLWAEIQALKRLQNMSADEKVGNLFEELQRGQPEGVEPADLYELSRELGYAVEISWARHGLEGEYDVAFWLVDGNGGPKARVAFEEGQARHSRDRECANDPWLGKRMRQLVPQLRSYLQEKLPAYMVPSAIVILEKLPLTVNGKVDRKALPMPERSRMELAGGYVGAHSEVEKKLVGIWSEVLGIERVGVHDDFFELGGHSLSATQVISRVRNAFHVEVALRSLFESPTVAGFAAIIVRNCEEVEKAEQMALLKRIESQTEADTKAESNTLPISGQIK